MQAGDARLQLDGSRLMSSTAVADFRAHALEAFPHECLGYVDAGGAYRRLENVAAEPERMGLTVPGVVPALMASGDLRALCHSHPAGPDAPTETDMRSQLETMIPFVLCATNGQATTEPFAWGDQLIDNLPLVGRPFRHGVTDCYGLIRAWWRRERGVVLPEYPRNWEWWQPQTGGSKDLYGRYFADAGFYPIDPADVRPGDCWLAAIRSEVPNHAGVVLDAGLCLHHASGGAAYDPTRLSKREPMVRWSERVTHWLRR